MNMKQFRKIFFIISTVIICFSYGSLSQKGSTSNQFTSEDSVRSLKYLSSELSSILTNANLENTKYAVGVYSLDNKKYYFKKSVNDLLTPASITKLFTSYSALSMYGSNFQYQTKVYYTGTLSNGILKGDIYIVGNGDPMLSSYDIDTLAQKIKQSGIVEIHGNIIGDGTFFDDITNRKTYSGDQDMVQALQPITGLSINNNTITIIVEGLAQGQKRLALVRTDPPSTAVQLRNTAKVIGRNRPTQPKNTKSRKPNEEIILEDGGPVVTNKLQKKSDIKITQILDKNGSYTYQITGSINADDSYSQTYFLSNPDEVVAGSLVFYLRKHGINVQGKHETGSIKSLSSEPHIIATHSRYLVNVISPTMKNSNNYYAENIFKFIGANSGKLIENARESRQIISLFFDTIKVDFKGCQLFDGSGLSRRNVVSVNSVIGFLNYLFHSDKRIVLDTTMAIAGFDGTLGKRMSGTLAESNLKGKTGTLRNVSGLCGITKTLDGENIAFCFIFNGNNVGTYKQLENKLGTVISEFFYFNRQR